MNRIIHYIRKQGGYATLKQLKAARFATRSLSKLLEDGSLEKIKPGLYRLPVLPTKIDFSESLIDVCRAVPEGIICLTSALAYHKLTNQNPSEVYVAIAHSGRVPQVTNPPIRAFYYRARFFNYGIETLMTKAGVLRIYCREKTLCDMFRYRNKLGEDLAIEGLKNYLRSKDTNLKRLQEYAVQCQVKTVLIPYLRALVG